MEVTRCSSLSLLFPWKMADHWLNILSSHSLLGISLKNVYKNNRWIKLQTIESETQHRGCRVTPVSILDQLHELKHCWNEWRVDLVKKQFKILNTDFSTETETDNKNKYSKMFVRNGSQS